MKLETLPYNLNQATHTKHTQIASNTQGKNKERNKGRGTYLEWMAWTYCSYGMKLRSEEEGVVVKWDEGESGGKYEKNRGGRGFSKPGNKGEKDVCKTLAWHKGSRG